MASPLEDIFMYIFRKKHFGLILFFLFLSLTFCSVNENISKRSYDITQVTAPPINEKTIIIDAGHRSEKTGVQQVLLE